MEDNFQLNSSAVSDRGLSEKRPQNEDSYLEMPEHGLFAVADGVGGAQAGDVASQMAMEILGEAFMHLQTNGDAEEMMKLAIERANSAIYQMSSDLPQLSTMATTIVALHVSGNIATIGHVGDSRLYRLDSKGNLIRETQDHSVVEEEVRAGRMTAAQAANHPSRNVISRALGAESGVEVDMKTIMFDGDTKFLLCSDGITRHITDFELREILQMDAAPPVICLKLKEICYSRGAEDNLTAVIITTNLPQSVVQSEIPASAGMVDEEPTIATVRQSQPEEVVQNFDDEEDEIPTRNLKLPISMRDTSVSSEPSPVQSSVDELNAVDDEAYLMEESAPEIEPSSFIAQESEPETVENPISIDAAPPVAVQQTSQPEIRSEERKSEFSLNEPVQSPENSSSFLSSLIFLVIGLLLGAGVFYLWQTMNAKPAEVPQITQMQSPNIPFSTFEQQRRTTDSNPAATIVQFEKSPPKDASDYYFLGRAYLLDKKYEEAVKSFLEARNKLGEYSETANKSVLETDITSGLLSAQNKAAFERELGFAKGVNSANQSNTNR